MTTLATELKTFLADFATRIPDEIIQTMREADEDLAATGIESRVLRAGDVAPDFSLPNAIGNPVLLSDRLSEGPVILTFYRGGWCPYCNLELRAYQRLLPEITAAGAHVIAVSPQTPDNSFSTKEKNSLAFDVLSDSGSEVAAQFGLAFELPESLKALYTKFGHALPEVNGTNDWKLPMPGTFVIKQDGTILLARASVNYRTRMEPREALEAISLSQRKQVEPLAAE